MIYGLASGSVRFSSFGVLQWGVSESTDKRDHRCDCPISSSYKHLQLLSNHWVKHSLSFTLFKKMLSTQIFISRMLKLSHHCWTRYDSVDSDGVGIEKYTHFCAWVGIYLFLRSCTVSTFIFIWMTMNWMTYNVFMPFKDNPPHLRFFINSLDSKGSCQALSLLS